MSKRYSFLAVTITCALALSGQRAFADTTVFNDTFNNGSTVDQSPVAPTANSASYEVAGNQTLATAPSITAGDFNLTYNNTSSTFAEMMAQFTASPITLATVGDTIDLTVTFVNTSHVLTAGDAGSRLDIGLYNSGGVAPLQGAMNLNSGSSFDSGGAAGWQGFYAEAQTASAGGYVGVRLPQSAPNGSVQDLLFNNASANVGFNNPPGEKLATTTGSAAIAQGTTNTFQLILTLTGASSMAISNTLYAGAGTGGTVLYSLNGTTNGVINSIDSLAFGWRFSGTKTISIGDIQQVMVSDDIAAVPEPSTVALVGAGLAMMLGFARRRRS